MKKQLNQLILSLFVATAALAAQAQTDSLVLFSELTYHSDFEKSAIQHFLFDRRDTLNLFLAIDELMDDSTASGYGDTYHSILKDLENKGIQTKNINKQIKTTYADVHRRFLKKYYDNVFFPEIFQSGNYNCVTASMLYGMVYNQLDIPFKVMASNNHVYLVANPGTNSIVIETTNPGFAKQIFTGDFKKQYVFYLKSSKLISEDEYKSKSVEEIFEEKFNEVREASFENLPGFQYHNKALLKYEQNDFEQALPLSQKAYFFYPDYQTRMLLYASLLYHIERSDFNKVTDIDYLSQLSRFEETGMNTVVGIFNNVVNHHLQYTNKEAFCDSLAGRMVSRLTDKMLIDEIVFTYNMQMSYRFSNSSKVEKYVTNALKIKGNYSDARLIFEGFLRNKLYGIYDKKSLLDTIQRLETAYGQLEIAPLLTEHKQRAHLELASEQFMKKKPAEANANLLEFEKYFDPSGDNKLLFSLIENAYFDAAIYYRNKGDKAMSKKLVSRGLQFAPGSKRLQGVVY